jgi:hypothetical protein
MKNLILTLLIFSIIEGDANGQSITPQTINIAGGTHKQGYYSIDWSVGELSLVSQLQSNDGLFVVSNGLIQPFTDHPNSYNYNRNFTAEEIRILPNPTRDVLEVNYMSAMRGPVMFRMYDATGRLLYQKQVSSYGTGIIERIDMTSFRSGAYMLYISINSIDAGAFKKSGGYKIVKLN